MGEKQKCYDQGKNKIIFTDKVENEYNENSMIESSSENDFKAIKEISKVVENSVVTSLARCNKRDIDIAYEAINVNKLVLRIVIVAFISFILAIICFVNLVKYKRRARRANRPGRA